MFPWNNSAFRYAVWIALAHHVMRPHFKSEHDWMSWWRGTLLRDVRLCLAKHFER